MSTLTLRNARLVLGREVVRGSLKVDGGLIHALDSGPCLPRESIDLEGDLLLPGLVEIHTDNFERHLMPRPKVQWAELPALIAHDAEVAASGITTVFDALGVGDSDPDSVRGANWDSVLRALDRCESLGLLRAEHHLHARCELPAPNAVALFEPFKGRLRLSLVSLMDHTPGQRQWENLEQASVYYMGKKGWSHERFLRAVEQSGELQSRYAKPHRAYFVQYCREHGITLASHDDTTVAHVDQAWQEGATVSEFPTTVVAAKAARERKMSVVMGGPNVVRGGSHSGNVAAAELARLGLLDILSSDYVPGSLLGAATRLVEDGLMGWPQAARTISWNPAQVCGLVDRGEIAPGLRADLIQVRLVEGSDGRQQAVVRRVWREGVQVV